MNAAAKALSQGNLFRGDFSFSDNRSFINFWIMMLWSAVICSALGVVYVKNLERQYIGKTEVMVQQNSQFEMEKSQLLLEKSMWSSPGRVSELAYENLNMMSAKPSAILIIKR